MEHNQYLGMDANWLLVDSQSYLDAEKIEHPGSL